jgi:raffinose/stachyose/melibiose transport system permease protein
MLSTIGGLKLFDQVYAATNGGPGYASETLSTVLYKQAFVFGNYGYSTAIALVLALVCRCVHSFKTCKINNRWFYQCKQPCAIHRWIFVWR